jgi:hypothetical protein
MIDLACEMTKMSFIVTNNYIAVEKCGKNCEKLFTRVESMEIFNFIVQVLRTRLLTRQLINGERV